MKTFFQFLLLAALLPVLFAASCDDEEFMPAEPDPPVVDTMVVTPPELMPEIMIGAGPYLTGCEISFTGNGFAGVAYSWLLSDGRTFTGANQSLTFDEPGSYTLTLTVTLDGRSEEESSTITVTDQETTEIIYQENDGYTRSHKIVPHPDGGYVSYGDYCKETSVFGNCIQLAFMVQWHNADGTVRTARNYPSIGTGNRIARAVTVTSDGNVLVVFESPVNLGFQRMTVYKLREFGNRIWSKTVNFPEDISPRAILETSDGRIVVGGYTKQSSDNLSQATMFWLSATGELEETQVFAPRNASARIERLVETASGDVLGVMVHDGRTLVANSRLGTAVNIQATGYEPAALLRRGDETIVVSSDQENIKITIRDAGGVTTSNRSATADGVFLYDAVLLDNGNFLVVGKRLQNGVSRGYLAQITPDATIVWENDTREDSFLRGIQTTEDCGYVVSGYIDPSASSSRQTRGYILKLNARGEL